MPKARIDVKVVMEMDLTEAEVMRDVLGQRSDDATWPLFTVLDDALKAAEKITKGVE